MSDTESPNTDSLQELCQYFQVHRENTQSSLASLPRAASQLPLEMGEDGTISHFWAVFRASCPLPREELFVAELAGKDLLRNETQVIHSGLLGMAWNCHQWMFV